MEIIVASRGMKATDILDMAYDMGFERPHIATAGEWDGGRVHILTYGPLAYRKTLEIASPCKKEHLEKLLRTALVSTEARKMDEPKPAEAVIAHPVDLPKPKAKRSSKAAH